MDNYESTIMVLGARAGGSHLIRTLQDSGVRVHGVYDQDATAPGIALARQYGIRTWTGHVRRLAEMLTECEDDPQVPVHLFLPSRDLRFIAFVEKVVAGREAAGMKNLKLCRLGRHFRDYATMPELLGLLG